MFTFRTTTIFFFTLFLAMIILQVSGIHVHYGFYLLLVAIYIMVSAGASFYTCSNFYMNAICRKDTEKKEIALTFDDGPDPIYTPQILDILKGHAEATFFCIGRKLEGREEILKRIDTEGHLIGIHSYSHSNCFDFYPARRMKAELQKSEEKVLEILGKRSLLFRPPYGVINPTLKNALQSYPYHVIGFSNRSFDTSIRDDQKILHRVTRKLKAGDIILFHDTVPQTVNVLKELLVHLEKKGFTIIRLDEFLNIQAYA